MRQSLVASLLSREHSSISAAHLMSLAARLFGIQDRAVPVPLRS
jgi:hypothetical protein